MAYNNKNVGGLFGCDITVKVYKRGASIEACYDIFFNETIEYDITNEESARFFEKIIRIRIINKILYPFI